MADKYRQGTPWWVDLATTDLVGAKAFYAGLFGWEYVDEEMGEMGIGDGDVGRVGGGGDL